MVGFRVRTRLRAGFTPRQALPPARPPSRPLPWSVLPPDQPRPARPPSAWSRRRSERGRPSRGTAAEAQHPAAQTVRPA